MSPERKDPPTLTKADLVDRFHQRLGISRADAHVLVDQVIAIMMDVLVDPIDGRLKVSRFGNFVVRRKAARMGRNPATDERLLLEKRRVLVFRSSALLRRVMNQRWKP